MQIKERDFYLFNASHFPILFVIFVFPIKTINNNIKHIIMASSKKQVETPQELENFENAVLTSEAFIEKNQKSLLIALVAILVVVTGWLLFRNMYQIPMNEEADALMAKSQAHFEQLQYDLALNGDSIDAVGFVSIADEYGSTPAGNLANAYAGLAYYKLGDFDAAIDYLSKFGGSDEAVAFSVVGTIGDCYVQKGETEKALSYFKQASKSGNVMVAATYALKLARAYVALDDKAAALDVYQSIKDNYKGVLPGMTDVDDVDKFIESLK